MKNISKFFIVLLILLLGVGLVSASDDVASGNETSVLSIDDNSSVVVDDVLGVDDDDEDILRDDFSEDDYIPYDYYDVEYQIIKSNITRYDFNDNYKVMVVDNYGLPALWGKVDFFFNNELVATSNVNFGVASFNCAFFILSYCAFICSSIFCICLISFNS